MNKNEKINIKKKVPNFKFSLTFEARNVKIISQMKYKDGYTTSKYVGELWCISNPIGVETQVSKRFMFSVRSIERLKESLYLFKIRNKIQPK